MPQVQEETPTMTEPYYDLDFSLGDLFIEEPVSATESGQVNASSPSLASGTQTADSRAQCENNNGLSISDNYAGGHMFNSDLPFGVKVDTYADTVRSLAREVDHWKAEAARNRKKYEDLQRKMCRTSKHDVDLPAEFVRRLERFESEVDRYRTENKTLRERVTAAETEVTTLQDHIAGQKNKLKGAGKKVRNAKDVAGKQEEKVKDAVREKQGRASSERKMKQKLDKALAEVASLTKLSDDLLADLEVEQAGQPHMRRGDSASDVTVAVVPVEFRINRAHFRMLSKTLETSKASVTMQLQDWYDEWTKLKEPVQKVVGADYVDDKKSGKAVVELDKLFGDSVEHGHQMTVAEHDGPRSKEGLETICRKDEARHNEYGTMWVGSIH